MEHRNRDRGHLQTKANTSSTVHKICSMTELRVKKTAYTFGIIKPNVWCRRGSRNNVL